MTFYIIGLGLNEKGISLEGLEALKKCKKVYLENYTVDFPYTKKELEKVLGVKIEELDRGQVENESFVCEAKKKDIALLIYGNALVATTHISLLFKCGEEKIPYKIIHAGSVFDAITETGLQLYKLGKITNITKHESSSFFKIIEENKIVGAHSLILLDIGLSVNEALKKLQEIANKRKFKLKEVIVCSRLGTKEAVMKYGEIEKLINQKKEFKLPACLIIPGDLHFVEKDAIEKLR
ncbi:diphthine synthase [Candidatus Woesearchaeota archaeon]|nr:diphthine synthase [Candidatus Woesearchaeota archaeon]